MNDAELSRLIEAYLRGTISDADFTTLEARLARDPGARREFRRAANLDSALRDWAARPRALDSWLGMPEPPTVPPRKTARPTRAWFAVAGAAAAVVALAAGVFAWKAATLAHSSMVAGADRPAGIEKTAQGCAVLTQIAGAEWSGMHAASRPGDILKPGSVRLDRGLAQIEFFSGAKLVVEGPAEFQIVSQWEVAWQHGKVRIHVPPAARGFRLQTSGMKLVDLGTEFGVEVNGATQDMRVAVFSGEVVAHPATGAQVSLREGEGIARRGAQLERTPAGRADDFTNGKSLQQLSQRHAQARFAAWGAAARAQAADPRLIAYYPLTEIDAWNRIIRNTAASGDHDFDGGAVGVSTAIGRWPEKPALQFKRPGDRVRLQIRGTYQALTLVGWVKVDGLDRTYNALFLTDGYEAGEPHWQIYEDGRLMFSLSYGNPINRTNNQVYFSPVIFHAANTGRWHHIAVTYENRRGEVVQYMDGREISREISPLHVPGRPVVIGPCEIGNWGLPTQNHRFPIRNLNGSIDEFALYQAALSPAEILALYEAGKPE